MKNEEKELLLKDLCSRLPYGVKMKSIRGNIFTLSLNTSSGVNEKRCISSAMDNAMKPALFPITCLTQEITVNGETFVPIDYFEVTDDFQTCPIEQDSGNVKLIRDLTVIAKNNVIFDTQFLPMWVIDKLRSWHINTSLPDHLFVPVTETFNPYK